MSDADKLAYLDSIPSKRKLPLRVWLIIAGGILVVGTLAALSVTRNPVVGRTTVLGLCLEVKAEDATRSERGEPLARVLVATPDKTEVQVLMPPPVPHPGEFVPLVVEEFKKGNKDYAVDGDKWRTEGPQ